MHNKGLGVHGDCSCTEEGLRMVAGNDFFLGGGSRGAPGGTGHLHQTASAGICKHEGGAKDGVGRVCCHASSDSVWDTQLLSRLRDSGSERVLSETKSCLCLCFGRLTLKGCGVRRGVGDGGSAVRCKCFAQAWLPPGRAAAYAAESEKSSSPAASRLVEASLCVTRAAAAERWRDDHQPTERC